MILLGTYLNLTSDQINHMLNLAYMEPLCAKDNLECAVIYAVESAHLNVPGFSYVGYDRVHKTPIAIKEYVPGITLREQVKQDGPLDAKQMYSLMAPIIQDLAAIHGLGLLHRDITPDNIMIRPDGVAKTMTVILNQQFAPKEQYLAKGNHGPWTDVYALCATIFFTLSGQLPEPSLERENRDLQKPLHHIAPNISVNLSNVIMKGMALQVRDRYQDMTSLLTNLQKVLHIKENTPNITPASPSKKVPNVFATYRRRKRRKVLAIACASLLVVGAGSYGIHYFTLTHTDTPVEITMPALENKIQDEACSLIRRIDETMSITIERDYNDTIPEGQVISQSISPGSIYVQSQGQELILHVSRGIETVKSR